MKRILLHLVIALVLAHPASAQYPGTLDSTFGTNGISIYDWGTEEVAQQFAVGPNDSIFLCGYSRQAQTDRFFVAKFSPDGTLVTGFGAGGYAEVNFGPNGGRALALKIQADGKVVAAGTYLQDISSGSTDLAVARLLPDGSLDPAFGNGGKILVATDSLSFERGSDLRLLPGGKILVTGTLMEGYQEDVLLVQFLPDGSLDSSFGQGGIATHGNPLRQENSRSSALQVDGKIVVAGRYQLGPSVPVQVYAARFHPDGRIDSTFGSNGQLILAPTNGNNFCEAVLVQPDGKILLGGHVYSGSPDAPMLMRLHTDGSLDTSFATGGLSLVPFSNGMIQLYDLLLEPDGSILALGDGRYQPSALLHTAICKYDAAGQLASGFGGNDLSIDGIGMDSVSSVSSFLNCGAYQSDGKVVAAGSAGNQDLLMVRYHTGIPLSAPGAWVVEAKGHAYPNPVEAGEWLTVPLRQNGKNAGNYRLYTPTGELVWEWEDAQKGRAKEAKLVVPAGLPPGIYLLAQPGAGLQGAIRLAVR